MRPVLRALLAAVPLAAALTGLAAPAADAQSTVTWTVSPGGYIGMVAPADGVTHLTDITTGAAFKCGQLVISGSLSNGSSLPSKIGVILDAGIRTRRNCDGDHLYFQVAVGEATPEWPVQARHYDPATGTTTGKITDVNLAIIGKTCTASLTGVLHWSHRNTGSTFTISAPGSLTAGNVTGCAGVISDGDTLTYQAHGQMIQHANDGSNNEVVITSP